MNARRRLLDGGHLWLAAAAFALLCLVANPVGFRGGGSDDFQYLEASRCWIAAGSPCIPTSHWETRWPVVAGTAAGSAILGESRFSIGLGALAAWCLGLFMAGWLGKLWFDRPTGALTVALIAAVPVVTGSALRPNADVTELAFQLSALALATISFRQQSISHALAAGVAAALAVQTRETSLVFCAVCAFACLLLPKDRRGILIWTLAGFLVAMAAELVVYWQATGDPFFRSHLSLGHVRVPSQALSVQVDTSQSPLFNPAYIGGWKREMGIQLWWAIDPWLNLLSSHRNAFIFTAGLLAVGFGASVFRSDETHALVLIGLAALSFSALLIYGLAIDPKSRMFLLPITAAAMTISVVAVRSCGSKEQIVPAALVLSILGSGVFVLSQTGKPWVAERTAARWMAQYPGEIEIDAKTRSWLTLVPGVTNLPKAGSGLGLRMVTGAKGCHALLAGSSLVRRPRLVAQAQAIGDAELCLLGITR